MHKITDANALNPVRNQTNPVITIERGFERLNAKLRIHEIAECCGTGSSGELIWKPPCSCCADYHLEERILSCGLIVTGIECMNSFASRQWEAGHVMPRAGECLAPVGFADYSLIGLAVKTPVDSSISMIRRVT